MNHNQYLFYQLVWFDCWRLYNKEHDWSLCQFADEILDLIFSSYFVGGVS